jgi:hypothetical protein
MNNTAYRKVPDRMARVQIRALAPLYLICVDAVTRPNMAISPDMAVAAWITVSVNAGLSITPDGSPKIPPSAVPIVTIDAQMVLEKYHGLMLFMSVQLLGYCVLK